jgi:hypothetical protein
VTVYEDDIGVLGALPTEIRSGVNVVHFYIHYRLHASGYEGYVREIRRLFPKATILAGAYAYDRIDYLPCGPGAKDKCSPDQEIALFRNSLEIQSRLMDSGAVAGIEFTPAMFGKEERWDGWDNPRACSAKRRQQCIDNTRVMRNIVLDVLRRKANGISIPKE